MQRINRTLTTSPSEGGDQPLVSIITPAYNAGSFLVDCIDSVLKQDYTHWELLIIVDVKSRDATAEIALEASRKDPRIKCIQHPECNSLYSNRNKGIDLAKGEFLAFLDSDDRWLPEKLQTQVSTMLKKNLDFSYHSFAIVNEFGQQCGPTRAAKWSVGFHDLLKNNCIGCLTVMIRKSFIKEKRMQAIHQEDFHFWLQLLQDGSLATPIPALLAEYRIHKNSVSFNKIKCAMWRWNVYKTLKLPFHKSIYYMVFYSISAIYKRI